MSSSRSHDAPARFCTEHAGAFIVIGLACSGILACFAWLIRI